jgi:aspartate racemase
MGMSRVSVGMDMKESASPGGKCLGLIGGLGVGATVHYYQQLVRAHAERNCVPDILMIHADVTRVLAYTRAGRTNQLAEYLFEFLERLSDGGAQVAAIPAVTPHICIAELREISPIPIIGLPDVILVELHRRQFRRVALLGTRITMESKMFGLLPGIEVVPPSADEIAVIQDAYVQIVSAGAGSDELYQRLRPIAHTICDRERVDAIVLGGTELSLLFDESNTDFPHVDGARVHIEAIMQELFL